MSTDPKEVFSQARLGVSIGGTFGPEAGLRHVPALYHLLRHEDMSVRSEAFATFCLMAESADVCTHLAPLVADPEAKLTHEAKRFLKCTCVHGYNCYTHEYSKYYESVKKEFLLEKPNEFRNRHKEEHATLLKMIDPDANSGRDRFCQMLLTFSAFVQYGSFRQVAMETERRAGVSRDNPDHTGPMYQVQRLAEILGIALTKPSEGLGRRRTELTEAGMRLGAWIDLHPYLID
jgi:hypothetical protein